jgi:diketogulonate reductase-like aldo/keto reductase
VLTEIVKNLRFPKVGLGTWLIGEEAAKESDEISAIRLGIELGMNLVDTAEMYGNGKAESLVGRALLGVPREKYLLVSKVLPQNAGSPYIFSSCENTLKRLGTDYLDVYLLHWRGKVPLSETVQCMEELVKQGKILHWGVSNFDVIDMEALLNVQNGNHCIVNQVMYNLGSRGTEFDLIPWMNAHGMLVMAYCPLAQGGKLVRMRREFLTNELLINISHKYKITVMQLLLKFASMKKGVIAIPKTTNLTHVQENANAIDVEISDEDWKLIDQEFPPPTEKMHLDME